MSDFDIKEIRTKLHVTQEELAKMLGVSVRTVQNWESGAKIPESKHAILRDLVVRPHRYAGGEQVNTHGDNINGNNVTVNKTDAEMFREMKENNEILKFLSEELDLEI